jgi:rod shape-determining protein MreD
MMVMPNLGPLSIAAPEEILRPVKPWFIVVTLALALAANLLPLSGVALALRPDFVALVLLYWCIQEPRFVGVGIAWGVGLLMDVGDATLFGQHALAYAFLAYAAEYFRRRVLRFPLWQQAAQVAVLLGLCAVLVLLVRFVGGAPLPRWTYAVPPLVGALLWPAVTVLLQWPQRPQHSSAEL